MSNKVKLIIAIVLVVIMIPVMGMMVVKDNVHNSSYCAACHADYYVTWATPETEYTLAHAHNQMSVSCDSCHQRTMGESVAEVVNYVIGNYYYPFPETTLSMDHCFACHDNYDQVIALTTTEITNEERNPHDGHWGQLECSDCHKAHRDSTNYCDECHGQYLDSDVPGWTTYEGE